MKRTRPPYDGHSTPPVGRTWPHWRLLSRPRDYWWGVLDYFEAYRHRRRRLLLALGLLLALVAAWIWGYPWWARRNAIRVAEEWLAAGNLPNAADAAKHAAEVAPDRPEPWLIASELARRGNQHDQALQYARRAADLAPDDSDIILTWAAAALRASQADETLRVLDRLPAEIAQASPHAQRLRGEIARQRLQLTAARAHFEAALALEGPLAVNEVPLGLILLQSADPALRQRGNELLVKWSTDQDWGVTALRTLVTDATNRNDREGMRRWGEALWAHPSHTVGDMPNALLALSRSDEGRFAEVLAELEKNHAVTPAAAAQLLSWLNQIGRGAEAARWMKTLPADGLKRPPLVAAAAEAYRLTGDWPALNQWVASAEWTGEADFLRWVYGLEAARRLDQADKAEEYQRTLLSRAQLNGVHGLFAAATLYSWGRTAEALALWWRVADQQSRLAVEALGSLARHFQVQGEAEGQYQVFRRLHSLQPADADISNNFAFFAALTGREQRVAETLARETSERQPDNANYLATYAFTLLQQGKTHEALAALHPRVAEVPRSAGLGFAYGLALAASGKKTEARAILERLSPDSLTTAEKELIRRSLGN